ncbi:ATP-binding protein [Sulfurihydrogenibium yellowstonense]|uniref:Conserved protein, with A weak D-galactarate dehydratase/altronate hydrolase domain n=1 Tax=Sulfurihydrogenibium yellowstonense SS-5 TaxID=432331 RepID=C4FI22_9AQUI|nr:ATP-binding protein [Sulfurihydrogenibium yellowstonense]EEP61275.1 conserved protein, with A weak D-galactarate dehydratase/altronate hydrolase domain [Sulfurihydrogenibium yellowstonense SS-5]
MKEMPIGIQTFEKIVKENYYYVDKTPFIKKLEQGGYYFLSRPRRFGKSLFLDTIKEAFSGNKELFKGLYIYDKWDWSKKHPIIKISFAIGTNNNSEKLRSTISFNLKNVAYDYKINLEEEELNLKFYELIRKLYEKYNEKVVILVDEYDKPILDAIENIEYAKENREILKDLYSALKKADPYIKLAFLTGVSRFPKVSIFSGLNQLNDITLDPNFATICGYTQTDLETVFADRIVEFDKEEVRKWYNGYSWLGEKVYNPFDILLLFAERQFRPYWFETGTPTFLIKLFKQNKYYLPELENLEIGEELLSNLDIDDLDVENLLFQTGYLTIKDVIEEPTERIYILSYPNFEVKKSFNSYFLFYFLQDKSIKSKTDMAIKLALRDNQIEKLKDILHRFFASIPYDWYRKNDLESYEGFYASIVYALFSGAGFETVAEDTTNKGRIDLTIIYNNKAYIIEFKVVEDQPENTALKQIEEKKYFEKYLGKYEEVYLIGIEFSKKDRNIVDFQWKAV